MQNRNKISLEESISIIIRLFYNYADFFLAPFGTSEAKFKFDAFMDIDPEFEKLNKNFVAAFQKEVRDSIILQSESGAPASIYTFLNNHPGTTIENELFELRKSYQKAIEAVLSGNGWLLEAFFKRHIPLLTFIIQHQKKIRQAAEEWYTNNVVPQNEVFLSKCLKDYFKLIRNTHLFEREKIDYCADLEEKISEVEKRTVHSVYRRTIETIIEKFVSQVKEKHNFYLKNSFFSSIDFTQSTPEDKHPDGVTYKTIRATR